MCGSVLGVSYLPASKYSTNCDMMLKLLQNRHFQAEILHFFKVKEIWFLMI